MKTAFAAGYLGLAFLSSQQHHRWSRPVVRQTTENTRHYMAATTVAQPVAPHHMQDDPFDLRPKQKTEQQQPAFAPPYIAHNAPKSTYLIINSPAIASFVLVKGFNGDALKRFTDAVDTVVMKNPILTGKAVSPENWWKDPQIGIEPGVFLPKCAGGDHAFVQTIDASDRFVKKIQNGALDSPADQLKFIDKHVAPLVPNLDTTLQQIQKQAPLFEANVVLLPDDYAVIYTKMSHCVGDLVTYYEILEQVSSVDKGEDVRPINWDNPLKAKHEIFPESLSKRDFERLYGFPFLLGIAKNLPSMLLRKKQYLVLSIDKIKAKKAALKASGVTGVSSNDIITAALCDANRSTDIFALTRSMRGVTPGIGFRDGGNLHEEIPFQRCAGRNPLVIHDILAKGKYFLPDEVPVCESITGHVGRISSCVVPIQKMCFGGCKPQMYAPCKKFLDCVPMDAAIIFRLDSGEDAVIHNFWRMKDSELLNDILADHQLEK